MLIPKWMVIMLIVTIFLAGQSRAFLQPKSPTISRVTIKIQPTTTTCKSCTLLLSSSSSSSLPPSLLLHRNKQRGGGSALSLMTSTSSSVLAFATSSLLSPEPIHTAFNVATFGPQVSRKKMN